MYQAFIDFFRPPVKLPAILKNNLILNLHNSLHYTRLLNLMSTALLMLIIMVIPNITLIIVNGCSFHCNHLAFMHQSCDTISFIFESIKTIKSLNIANIASTRGPWYKSFIENTQELTKMTTTFTNTLENICKLYEVHETYARNLKKNFVDASTNEFLIMKHLD